MRRAALCAAACLLAFTARAADGAGDDPRLWLERMSRALATENYDGLFTHSTGNQTETMRIVHRSEKGRSVERLVSLDGSGREIVRTRDEVHAYLPDRRVVLVEPRGDDGSLLKALPTPGPTLDRYYEISVAKGSRLLGREVRVIDVRPRDIYRYGYRLWLDVETSMPLQSVVVNGAGRPVEQIRFTRLELKDKIPARDIEPTVDAAGFRWIRTDRKLAAMPQLPAKGGWRPLRVPPGFRLVASRLQPVPGSALPAHHLIFSDGLAAISVFIEPGPPAAGPRPPESSSMGSANAYSTSIQGHVVTAIGEVPAATVREIANSVGPLPATPAASQSSSPAAAAATP
jgi:sigma-E factor negative regulatory protein RseB